MVINPHLSAAKEIARILSFPAALSVEPFARGRIDMIGFRVCASDRLTGVPLSDFHRERLAEVLICAAEHDGEILIPNGDFIPRTGDKLYMVGTKAELQKMLRGHRPAAAEGEGRLHPRRQPHQHVSRVGA